MGAEGRKGAEEGRGTATRTGTDGLEECRMQRSEVRENRTANSHTDGHGQARTGTDRKRGRWFYLELGTLWRGQNAEVRGQGEPNSRNSRTAF